MSAIAEALVATALGLVVAIPAVAAFNYLQGRITKTIERSETLGYVVLAYLEGRKAPSEGGNDRESEPRRTSFSPSTKPPLVEEA